MKRNDVLVIRIGLSIECADDDNVAVTVEPQDHGAAGAVRCQSGSFALSHGPTTTTTTFVRSRR